MIDKYKTYDTADIQIIEVWRGESVRNDRECYDCTVIIDDNRYSAKWYPSDEKYLSENATARGVQNLLVIYVRGRKNTVTISDGVIKAITNKIKTLKGETKMKKETAKSDKKNIMSEAELEALTARAQSGDVDAQAALGEYYYHNNRRGSKKLAVTWLERAAAKGNANAQYRLAHCYMAPRGVRQSDSKARKYFELAAEQGHIKAMWSVGYMCTAFYYTDYKKAFYWFQKGAELGDGCCLRSLAHMYLTGSPDVPPDIDKAMELYEKAAEQGEAPAYYSLMNIYLEGRYVPQDLGKAIFWAEKYEAYASMGYAYLIGEYVPFDLDKATEWFERAAEKRDYAGYVALGDYFLSDKSNIHDVGKAVFWYEKAARNGNIKSQVKLGDLYNSGVYIPRDVGKAIAWYEKAVPKYKDAYIDYYIGKAAYALGSLYFNADGVEQNIKTAKKFFRIADKCGHDDAIWELTKIKEIESK